MFASVIFVCLFWGYIRGRFVLHQRHFLIGRAASVQIQCSLSLWFVSSMWEKCRLCFVILRITTWLHCLGNFFGLSEKTILLKFLYIYPLPIYNRLGISLFAFSDLWSFQDLWVAGSNYFSKSSGCWILVVIGNWALDAYGLNKIYYSSWVMHFDELEFVDCN